MSTDALDPLRRAARTIARHGRRGTQAKYGELSDRDTRYFMCALSEMVDRCNQAYMDHHEADTDARIRAQSQVVADKALAEGGSVQ